MNLSLTVSSTRHAFKEWEVTVNALTAGKIILLFRKGGIKEVSEGFKIEHQNALLYPTYEHQKPQLLKPEYAAQVKPVSSSWHPETVTLKSWAEITHLFSLSDELTLEKLLPYHIGNEQFARERFNWKPRQPLSILLLRIYQLNQPSIIPYSLEYGGCKSWLELLESVNLEDSFPVLETKEYHEQVEAITGILAGIPSTS